MRRADATRRTFLKQAGAIGSALAAPSLCARGADDPPVQKRISIKEFSANTQALADFRRAVGKMRNLSPKHPFSWVFQANIHWRPFFPDYVYDQADVSDDTALQLFRDALGFTPEANVFNTCPHGNWWFLPWHRAYLYYFERILRWAAGTPSLVLPYWNYNEPDQRELPIALRQPMVDGAPNPLHLPSTATFRDTADNPQIFPMRDEPLNNGLTQLTAFVTSPASLGVIPFTNSAPTPPREAFGSPQACDAFCQCGSGAVERIPHNVVHLAIGGSAIVVGDAIRVGFMGDVATAARDPAFWLHHCQIDRLWESWIALQNGRLNPQDPAWLDYEFTFYDVGPDNTPVPVQVTPAQLLNTKSLGYEYDQLEPAPATVPRLQSLALGANFRSLAASRTAAVPPIDQPLPHGMARTGTALSSTAAKRIPIRLQPNVPPQSFRTALAERPETSGELHLLIEGIEMRHQPGVYFDLYLNLPANAKADPNGPHYVGSLAFFAELQHGGNRHGSHAKQTKLQQPIRMLVPPALRRALHDEQFDPSRMEVTFVPQTGTETTRQGIAAPARIERTSSVTIGQVRLLLVR